MGLRGPLAGIRHVSADPVADLAPPPWLTDPVAREHYLTHSKNAADNRLLTTQTQDSFALMCDLWGKVRELQQAGASRVYLDTLKAYQCLAKLFRLLPVDKPGEMVTSRTDHLEELPSHT